MREQAGWSTYELAQRAGVSQPTIVHWEQREARGSITLATLARAAAALQCEVDYRLVKNPEPAPVSTAISAKAKKAPQRQPQRRAALVTARTPARSSDPNEIWQ